MALSTPLTDPSMAGMAEAISDAISRFAGTDLVGLELGEALPVFYLSETYPQSAGDDGKSLVRDSGRTHVQIYANGVAEYYARAKRDDAGQWTVVEISKSPIAGKIDSALDRVYEDDANSAKSLSLFDAPSHYLVALMLSENNQNDVVTVSSADTQAIPEGIAVPLHDLVDLMRKSPPVGLRSL